MMAVILQFSSHDVVRKPFNCLIRKSKALNQDSEYCIVIGPSNELGDSLLSCAMGVNEPQLTKAPLEFPQFNFYGFSGI